MRFDLTKLKMMYDHQNSIEYLAYSLSNEIEFLEVLLEAIHLTLVSMLANSDPLEEIEFCTIIFYQIAH